VTPIPAVIPQGRPARVSTQGAQNRERSGKSVTDPSNDESKDDEQALVLRAQAGDRAAFRALYQRFAPSVYRYAIVPTVHDRTLAEDLLADTFVRALENLHRFKWQGRGLLPWLIRIAKNLCLDHLRKSGRVGAWPVGFENLLPDPGDLGGESEVNRKQMAAVMRTRIDACLEGINPRYRKVVELRLVQQMPREQAATEMDVSIGTLDVLLFRACKAFRKVYVQRYGESPQRDFEGAS
jgi:RNA polymerase sigma-70 factor (ECF subfamily)